MKVTNFNYEQAWGHYSRPTCDPAGYIWSPTAKTV